ncbi:MAG: hypothetical protein GXX99_06800 [Clostridiales bacterium]|nr:hypothetical protein [Clostridiales bacterium]
MLRFQSRLTAGALAVLLLCAALPTAALAAEAPAAEPLRFEQVAELLLEHSPHIRKNRLELLNLSSNDKLEDRQAELAASSAAFKDGSPASAVLMQQIQAQVMAMSPTPVQADLYALQIELANQAILQSGEQLYYGLIRAQSGLETLRRARPLLEQAVLKAETAQAAGMGTEAALLEARAALADHDAQISAQALSVRSLIYHLNMLLGRDYDRALETAPLPAPDLVYYGAIDLAADLGAMQKASFQLRALERALAGIGDDDYDATVRERQIKEAELQIETNRARARFEQQYHEIGNLQAACENRRAHLALAGLNADSAETAFAAGLLSELALEQAREALRLEQDALQQAEWALFWNIELYKWALKGLPLE